MPETGVFLDFGARQPYAILRNRDERAEAFSGEVESGSPKKMLLIKKLSAFRPQNRLPLLRNAL
jgi:hypothetical protein